MTLAFRVPADLRGERLDKVVTLAPGAREARIGRREARALIERGAVTLDGRAIRLSSHRVRGGEALAAQAGRAPPPAAADREPSLRLLYRDEAVVAVDKPAGVPSEPTRDARRASVVSLAQAQLGLATPPGLPHRLDRDTSGVLLLALTPEALAALNESLRERTARKVYVALVHGVFEGDAERTIESFVKPVASGRIEKWGSVRAGGKKAITLVRVLGRGTDRSLVECDLLTGRTHQARVHLAEAGHPIVGDELYGAPAGEHARVGRHLLHARTLEAPHPMRPGETLTLECPAPFGLASFPH